jgi:ABC-type branched-subunit amino acid transport system permease subunit
VNRRLLVPLSVVLVGVVYAFLAQFTLASVVAYALGAAVVYAAWRLDEEHPASGWARLAAVVLGMLILLSGKGWRGSVPWQTLVFTGTTILTFALFSLGLNLEFGFGGLINFGHVAFMALGAYTVALLAVRGGFWATQPGILVAFLLALAVAAVAGLLLALPAIRLREDYLAIVTIAAAEILRRVLRNEQDLTRGARGVPLSGSLRPLHLQALADVPLVGPWIVGGLERLSLAAELTGSAYLFVLAGIVLALTALLVVGLERLVHSPWGRVVEAIREDEDAVRSLGVNPTRYKLQVFALGSAVAAAAGAVWVWQLAYVEPQHFKPIRTFWAWIMIVVGGVADNKGAIAGAFVFFTLQNLTRGLDQLEALGLDSGQVAAVSPLVLGLILIGVMMYKPEGLFGDREELELVE